MHSVIALTTSFPAHSRSAAAKSKTTAWTVTGPTSNRWVYLASGYNKNARRTPQLQGIGDHLLHIGLGGYATHFIFGIDHCPDLAVIAGK